MKKNKYALYFLLLSLFLLVFAGCGGGGGSSTGIGGYSIISTGSVTLAWDAPTTNEDGTDLVDLAGYNIYYYPQESPYSAQSVQIDNAFTSASVSGLTPGTWCFVTRVYDYSGNESTDSNVICADVSA